MEGRCSTRPCSILVLGLGTLLVLIEFAAIPFHSHYQLSRVRNSIEWGANLKEHLGIHNGAHSVLDISDSTIAQVALQANQSCRQTVNELKNGNSMFYFFHIEGSINAGLGDWLWEFAENSRFAVSSGVPIVLGDHPDDFDNIFKSPFGLNASHLSECLSRRSVGSYRNITFIDSLLEYERKPSHFAKAFSVRNDITFPRAGSVWDMPNTFKSDKCEEAQARDSYKGEGGSMCFRAPPYESMDTLRQFSAAINMMIGKPSQTFMSLTTPWLEEMKQYDVRIGMKLRLGDAFMQGSEELPADLSAKLEDQVACAMRMVTTAPAKGTKRLPSIWVLVASDYEDGPQIVEDVWTSTFPNQNVTIKHTAGAATHTADSKRLLDLYLLSRTDFILDNARSMFALSAAALMPNPVEVLGNTHCFNGLVPILKDIASRTKTIV